MSKSILQEIATFNAEMFNESKLKAEILDYKQTTDEYYSNSNELANDNISSYKILVSDLTRNTSDINELLKASMLQLEIDLKATEVFTIDEISKNYHVLGSLSKNYQRADKDLNNRLDTAHQWKIEELTGPTMQINIDPDTLAVTYGTLTSETLWSWMYIQDKNLRYKGLDLFKLDATESIITIGEPTKYKTVYMPSDFNLENNFNIYNGVTNIISPSIGDNSLTVNGNILSTDGLLKVELGVETTIGNIQTTIGNLITLSGNVEASDEIHSGTGYYNVNGGYTVTGVGSFTTNAGDFVSTDGGVDVTTGFTSTGGNISITAGTGTTTGNFTTNAGDFITDTGDFHTKDGDFVNDLGNLILTSGYALLSDGDLTLSNGDVTLTLGDLILTDGDLEVTGDTTLTGPVEIFGNSTLTGKLDLTDKFWSTYTGPNTFDGSLHVVGALTTDGGIDVTGDSRIIGNLEVTGVLDIKGSGVSYFKGDVDASGQTMTAAIFDGTATSAQYADLAEKYQSDIYYEPGTVVSIGIDSEITLYDPDLPLAGVISTDPGYLLNNTSETNDYMIVALAGRIPVFTDQIINRGMYIFPDKENLGKCIGIEKKYVISTLDLIGVALNDSIDGKVEVKV